MSQNSVRRILLALGLFVGLSAVAADDTHEHSFDLVATPSGPSLSIDDAIQLALTDQPILSARTAAIDADEQQAIAAAQLPDPKLSVGLKDLPVDRDEAFSFRDDSFTIVSVGLSQDFPRGDKRRLKGERKRLDAEIGRVGLETDRRAITRDAALAWIDVYENEQTLLLTHQLVVESDLQERALENDYRNGRVAQADWFAAKVETALAGDKQQDAQHHVERMRAALSRWIGDAAQRPLTGDFSTLTVPPDFPILRNAVDRHPMITSLQKQIDVSDNDVAMARQAYKSDFSVEGYFGYRASYADFAGVQVSMDLPFFTAKRQDRELSAALQQSNAAQDRKADASRKLRAEATEDYIDWHHSQERTATFDAEIIPDAQRRIDAAQSAYASGRGTFEALLMARRSLLDVQLQRLALSVDAARAQVRLQYFVAQGDVS